MTQYILYIIGAFILSMGCGFVFIPLILNFCKKKGLYDKPDSRKIHKNAIPRLGGLSFLPSMLLASIAVLILYNQQFLGKQLIVSSWSVAFFLCLLIIYGVGLIDDLVGLGAKTKFFAQIAASIILTMSGLYINNLYGFLGVHEIPFSIGAPLTIFIVVFISNAINLIDGIDGLSGGLSLIALAGFEYGFMGQKHLLAYGILIAGLMGVIAAFLYFNLLGKAEQGRKIFMGDSGSLTLGFILGFLFVKLTMDNPRVSDFNPHAMVLAYSLLIVPVYDVVRVSLVRIRHCVPIFQADKNHIHHKLMRTGLNQHRALVAILLLALGFIAINLVLNSCLSLTLIVVCDIVLWMLFHAVVNGVIAKKGLPVYLKNSDDK